MTGRHRRTALVAAAVAAGAARAGWESRDRVPGGPRRWERVNHRGGALTLLEGPAWAAGALAGLAPAPGLPARLRGGAALAVAGSAVLGAVDDLAGDSADKGLRGHLGALARGRLTTGGAKVLGIGATGVATAALVLGPRPAGQGAAARRVDVLVAGGVVAGAANLLNLLDLRPGRALKVALVPAPFAAVAGPAAPLVAAAAGASAALLPEDLGERAMLGDSGANAAGALLGTALVAATAGRRRGGAVRVAALAALAGLTLASERVSFTRVIEGTPGLRALDALGRRR